MAKGDPYIPVVIAAAELKRRSPIEFELLFKAMEALKEHHRSSLVVADGHSVFQAQGKSQVLDQLVKKLEDCIQLAETYVTRK